MTTTSGPRPSAGRPPTPSLPGREDWADLAADLTGALITPTDDRYATAATPWNLAVPSRPAAVVRAADAADVAATIRWAGAAGLLVDVRATGHGALPADDRTVLVLTTDLDEVVVHPEGWARVGAGVRWTAVLEAADAYGLAPVCGSAPGVGVVGFLTGGGLGPAARSLGVGSDHVRAFDVVTGDGVLRRATPTENPALFWGLCGGKGALGVVTAVEIDLLPLRTVYGGALYFAADDIAAVLHAWQRWSAGLPAQATTSVAILRPPAAPSVPPSLAGRCTAAVRFVWTGDPAEGERVLAPMLAVASPLLGGVGELPYARLGSVHADPVDPMPTAESALLLHDLDARAVDALLAGAGPGSDCPQLVVEIRQLGGAVGRTPARGDALSHRNAAYAVLAIGIAAGPAAAATGQHARRLAVALDPWTTGGGFPNFGGAATADTLPARYDAATLDRLASLARAYDPRGVLSGGAAFRELSARV